MRGWGREMEVRSGKVLSSVEKSVEWRRLGWRFRYSDMSMFGLGVLVLIVIFFRKFDAFVVY